MHRGLVATDILWLQIGQQTGEQAFSILPALISSLQHEHERFCTEITRQIRGRENYSPRWTLMFVHSFTFSLSVMQRAPHSVRAAYSVNMDS